MSPRAELLIDGEGHRVAKYPNLRPDNEYTIRRRTDYIVVHCSATKPSWDGGVEQIREWHVDGNHWSDVGYHFVIRRDGLVETGRPAWSVGSGVRGYNAESLHICLVGGVGPDGKTPENNFTSAQMEALTWLVGGASKSYPKAVVLGHRDFPGVAKACPSFDVKSWWGTAEVGSVSLEGFVMLPAAKGRQ